MYSVPQLILFWFLIKRYFIIVAVRKNNQNSQILIVVQKSVYTSSMDVLSQSILRAVLRNRSLAGSKCTTKHSFQETNEARKTCTLSSAAIDQQAKASHFLKVWIRALCTLAKVTKVGWVLPPRIWALIPHNAPTINTNNYIKDSLL